MEIHRRVELGPSRVEHGVQRLNLLHESRKSVKHETIASLPEPLSQHRFNNRVGCELTGAETPRDPPPDVIRQIGAGTQQIADNDVGHA